MSGCRCRIRTRSRGIKALRPTIRRTDINNFKKTASHMNKKIIFPAILSTILTGCVASPDCNNEKPTIYLHNANMLPCPVCKHSPTICKYHIGQDRGYVIPPDADDTEYIYGVHCRTKGCPVRSMGYKVWREVDAVEGWNNLIRPWIR